MTSEAKIRAEFVEKVAHLNLVAVECPKCRMFYGVPEFLLGHARSSCCNAPPRRIDPITHAQTSELKESLSISKKPDEDERSKAEKEATKWAAWILERLDIASSRASDGQDEKPKTKGWWDNMADDTMKQLNRNDLLSLMGKSKVLPSRRLKSDIDYF